MSALVFCAVVYLLTYYLSSLSQQLTSDKGKNGHIDTATYTEHTLVLYAFYESEERKANLQFFIDFAIKKNNSNIDYVIIANGFSCTVEIPTMYNIYVIRRENTGFDACAWKQALAKMKKEKGRYWYNYVFFLNASVRGPFLPGYAEDQNWISLFTKYLTNDIKLVGTSIFCPDPRSPNKTLHLQSMFLATDQAGLTIVEPILQCGHNKEFAINNVEMKLTQAFLKNGYNIASLLKRWQGHDFRDKAKTQEMCEHDITGKPHGDPYFHNLYFSNVDISPFEVIFFKTNRGVNDDLVKAYTKMMYEKMQN
ncbi:unnamed protein product [Owenia fusiformis]|uniref:Uncharacterized protein n=1 Tax=Owenia fusiformis TaxID=6347 RepID=A0A8S4P187_OWEFU|nr:unnamed protein product [Owenia fusiformis]